VLLQPLGHLSVSKINDLRAVRNSLSQTLLQIVPYRDQIWDSACYEPAQTECLENCVRPSNVSRSLTAILLSPRTTGGGSVDAQALDGRQQVEGGQFRDKGRRSGLEELLAGIRIGPSGEHDHLHLGAHTRYLYTPQVSRCGAGSHRAQSRPAGAVAALLYDRSVTGSQHDDRRRLACGRPRRATSACRLMRSPRFRRSPSAPGSARSPRAR